MPEIAAIEVTELVKRYPRVTALDGVSLRVEQGEFFGLLGPNGAGKTTLISIVCGITIPSGGSVKVRGFDIVDDFRETRSRIGLVPQEFPVEAFESVWDTVSFSRGLFGKPPKPAHIEKVLRSLSLWDKRDSRIMDLSGGMKRRVLIAKALSHEPELLFLDEPTAGVDVELRQDMWNVVRELRANGTTIVLTTHYIEEAEEMADRVGVINRGEIVLVRDKELLMKELGQKQLFVVLQEPMHEIPSSLDGFGLELVDQGRELCFTYDTQSDRTGITTLLSELQALGVLYSDLRTEQSSLEDIFVGLVKGSEGQA
jgi:ABC-2 type transport system ATP-binding protein